MQIDYLDFFLDFKQFLIEANIESSTLKGLDEDEIYTLEKDYKIIFPLAFRQFLFVFGKNMSWAGYFERQEYTKETIDNAQECEEKTPPINETSYELFLVAHYNYVHFTYINIENENPNIFTIYPNYKDGKLKFDDKNLFTTHLKETSIDLLKSIKSQGDYKGKDFDWLNEDKFNPFAIENEYIIYRNNFIKEIEEIEKKQNRIFSVCEVQDIWIEELKNKNLQKWLQKNNYESSPKKVNNTFLLLYRIYFAIKKMFNR